MRFTKCFTLISNVLAPSSPVHNRRLLSARNMRMSSVELPDDNEKSLSSASTSPCPSPVGGKVRCIISSMAKKIYLLVHNSYWTSEHVFSFIKYLEKSSTSTDKFVRRTVQLQGPPSGWIGLEGRLQSHGDWHIRSGLVEGQMLGACGLLSIEILF